MAFKSQRARSILVSLHSGSQCPNGPGDRLPETESQRSYRFPLSFDAALTLSQTAHGHPVATSLSAFTLAYLSLAIPLQAAQHVRPISPSKQRFVILVELYALTWFLLVGATVLAQRVNILGLSWIALWNASLLVAVILAMLEGSRDNRRADQAIPPREESEDDQVSESGEQQESEDFEAMPLLGHATSAANSRMVDKTQDFWWIFQFIFAMTAPVLNLATVYSIWVGAMPQTIPDGGWVGIGMRRLRHLLGIS